MQKIKAMLLLGALMISAAASADLSTGLIAHYSFDDCTANDNSGESKNGTISGSPTCTNGKIPDVVEPTAFNFNGTTDYIEIPHPGLLAEGSVAGWVYYSNIPKPLPGNGLYWFGLTQQGLDQGDGVQFGQFPWNGSNIAFGIWGSTWNLVDSGVTPVKGQWYHMVATFGANGMQIYLNGKLKGKNAYTGGVSNFTHSAYLAVDAYKTFFNGSLDDVRIYNRALMSSEITELYNAGSTVKGTITSLGSHIVTCENKTTGQIVKMSKTKTTTYDCEAKGLKINTGEDVSISIEGKAK
ncbi:MAG: LamG domain-containing protein [Methylococcaceae bacterium]